MPATPCTPATSGRRPSWCSGLSWITATVAGLPDAADRLAAAERAAAENDWAAAALARAAARLHGDRSALIDAAAGWERIGARFEHAATLALLS